jgi:hypothetical protein
MNLKFMTYMNILKKIFIFLISDYETNNIYNIIKRNKKVPGLTKDENNGKIMLEFVGLRSKIYAYTVDDDNSKKYFVKKSKGSTKSSIKSITFNDYKNCLFDQTILEKVQKVIRSKNHKVSSIKQKNIVLSPFDDKRILNFDTTDTRPWGYMYQATPNREKEEGISTTK